MPQVRNVWSRDRAMVPKRPDLGQTWVKVRIFRSFFRIFRSVTSQVRPKFDPSSGIFGGGSAQLGSKFGPSSDFSVSIPTNFGPSSAQVRPKFGQSLPVKITGKNSRVKIPELGWNLGRTWVEFRPELGSIWPFQPPNLGRTSPELRSQVCPKFAPNLALSGLSKPPNFGPNFASNLGRTLPQTWVFLAPPPVFYLLGGPGPNLGRCLAEFWYQVWPKFGTIPNFAQTLAKLCPNFGPSLTKPGHADFRKSSLYCAPPAYKGFARSVLVSYGSIF